MERRDMIVAVVGGILLVVATLGVGLTGVGEEGGLYQVVVYDGRQGEVPGDLGTVQQASQARYEDDFALDALHIDHGRLTVTATATGGFVGGATLHVRLVAPNGTAYEHEERVNGGAGALVVDLRVPGAPRPEERSVEALSLEDARAQVQQGLPAPVNGTWLVEAAFASSGPAPATNVDISYVFSFSEWIVDVLPPASPR